MGFICDSSSTKRFGFGTEFPNVYGRLATAIFNLEYTRWECEVYYYASKEARDYHRLIDYCKGMAIEATNIAGVPLGIKLRDKPVNPYQENNYSDEDWKRITELVYRPNPNILFAYRYFCSTTIIGAVELNKATVMTKIYEDFLSQCEPGSTSIIEDTPIETVLANYLAEPVPVAPLQSAINYPRSL